MLGTDLVKACSAAGHQVTAWDLPEIDITKPEQIKDRLPEVHTVINCAAFTRVDDAETHRDLAYHINADGPLHLARECVEKKMRLFQISTDYVFDGQTDLPYPERAQTAPLGIYGASKLAGEKAVRSTGGRFLIIRSQSLFGVHGPNFVKAIARKLKEGVSPLRVVKDQIMAPTYTGHLAEAIVKLLGLNAEGVIHVTAAGSCSWFDFAREIVARVKPGVPVEPLLAVQLNLPAKRPGYSVLSNRKFRLLTGGLLPSWQEGLDAYLKEEGALS